MGNLFQVGGALSPDSTAFDKSIYQHRTDTQSAAQDAVHFLPQVIGSPRLTGKTTQVNTIVRYHERLTRSAHVLRIECAIPKNASAMREVELRTLLSARLSGNPLGSLIDILRSSPLLGKKRGILAIINSERIAPEALRWLLVGFKEVHENHLLRSALKTQLLIDGSFSVDTLTSSPDSDYPLPQAFPPEFTEVEQANFLGWRLAQLKLRPTRPALRTLWECTAGDKYLTQAVGQYFATDLGQRSRLNPVRLGPRELRVPFERHQWWQGLFEHATEALASLVLHLAGRRESTVGLVDRLTDDWAQLPSDIKAVAYDGGLVRRTGVSTVSQRAPILTERLREWLQSTTRSLVLLETSFSIRGTSTDDRPRALDSLLQILCSSARSDLLSLHVGWGEVVAGGVKVKASILGGGNYVATWTMPTHPYHVGSLVWVLHWTVGSHGGRHTEQRIFGMQSSLREHMGLPK